jgi:hypothetical protein
MPNKADEQPRNATAEEMDVDQILADSFPASDAPPWTLGVTQARPNNRHARGRSRNDG